MGSAPAGPGESKTVREVRAGLCGQGLVPDGFPVPGQEFVHTGVRQIGDAGEDIGEPGLRIDIVELGGDDEGVHRRGALAPAVGAAEQPRPSAQSDRAFILPISGRIVSFTIAGTLISDAGCALSALSNTPATRSRLSRCNQA